MWYIREISVEKIRIVGGRQFPLQLDFALVGNRFFIVQTIREIKRKEQKLGG